MANWGYCLLVLYYDIGPFQSGVLFQPPILIEQYTHSAKAPVTGGPPNVLNKILRFTVHMLHGVMTDLQKDNLFTRP